MDAIRGLSVLLGAAWLAIVVAQAAGAQVAPSGAARQLEPAVAISAASERSLQRAFDRLYDLDFAPALALFAELSEAEPDSAAVPAFWSSALLYEIFARQGSLRSQLFATNAFLREPPPVDPDLEARYLRAREEAERRAAQRLAQNPDDADGLLALGLVRGNAANYLAGIRGEYFQGLRRLEEAYAIHSRLRAMRPDIHDTGVVLGVRDYTIGSLPGTIRFLLLFVGARGDRERGLEYLRDCAERGGFLAPYAQVLLAIASIREGDLATATALAERLSARYPRNPLLVLERVKLYREQQRYAEAARLARELIDGLAAEAARNVIAERARAEALTELRTIDELDGR